LLDTAQWGAQYEIPIQFPLPSLGPFQISPGVNYSERWYDHQFIRSWDSAAKKVDTTIIRGFYSDRSVSFNLGLNLTTALYGMYNFRKSSHVKAIRHTVRPLFGLGFTPDLSKSRNFYTTQVDTSGNTSRFSKYDGNIFQVFGEGGGPSATINFGIDNILEMKVRSKVDTSVTGDKKIRLIDAFGFTSSYNLLADSFNLAPFQLKLSSSALFEKINISATAAMDPYQLDNRGRRINQYTWSGGKFSPGRITDGGVTINANFQSKNKDAAKKPATPENNVPVTMEEQQAELDYIRSHPAEFADFKIPWSFNVSYSLYFRRVLKEDYSGFRTDITSGATLNGDFNLSPKWKLGMQTFYDVRNTKIQSLSLNISRDMHCWQMAISITPIGIYKTFSITLNPKSGILRDLRINRSRSFYGGN
jgi:hypothetical protein